MSLLSTKAVLKEIEYMQEHSDSVDELLGRISGLLEINYGDKEGILRLNEAEEYNKVTEHLRLEVFDIDRFVKVNDCKCVTNPRAFIRPGIPSDDGLLSNEIFGLTMDERSGVFGYIDLHGYFIDPSCYKAWVRINPRIKDIVHGTKRFKVDKKGQLVEDPEGNTGIVWLKSICDQLKFEKKDSITRDISRQYVEMNRNNMWINKYIVIPPFYRDKNTQSTDRSVGLGGVNKLYSNLIIATNALKETQDYLFNPEDAMYARVQEYILNIYNWFCGNTDKTIKTDMGTGLSGKFGLIQGAALSKTANYTSRLVISAPELKVERPEDMMVNFDKSAIPISTCLADFKDFIIFNAKRFFENEFMGKTNYPVFANKEQTKIEYYELDDPMIEFSDERIKHEMDRFLHGYNNRFVPIEAPLKDAPRKFYMGFSGIPNNNPEAIFHRYLTWLDVFFIAAHQSVKDKQVLITRFPINLKSVA